MRHFSFVYAKEDDLLRIREEISSHPPHQTLIQVFCGIPDPEAVEQLRAQLLKHFPGTGIIGASSAGEIANAQVQKQTIVLSISLFDHTSVTTALVPQNSDLKAAGKAMAEALAQYSPEVVITFGCGLKNGNFDNDLPYLKVLYGELGGIPLAGGQAGGYAHQGSRIFVFTERGLTETGFVAAALSGDKLRMHTDYNLGWVPLGKKMTVTDAEENRLYSIDGMAADVIYKHYLGIESGTSTQYFINNFPLMTECNAIRTTNPISAVHEDGSLELIQGIRTGEQVQFSLCDISLQEKGAKQLSRTLRRHEPEAVFIYTCVYRMEIFGEDIVVDMEAFKCCKKAAGFFTFGEYFTEPGSPPLYFQQTMTVLALSESRVSKADAPFTQPAADSPENDARRLQILRALSHLVTSTSQELESMNQRLTEQANKDGLTKLSNRRTFDETLRIRIKDHRRSVASMSLILLDVDYFKRFNDHYGHVAGDDCLRGIAQVLRKKTRRMTDMPFRYGGEEFACILSFTDHEGAMEVAKSIRAGVERLKIPHEESKVSEYVTASLGVLTVCPHEELSPVNLISACDNLLYEAKSLGRNQIVGKKYCTGDE